MWLYLEQKSFEDIIKDPEMKRRSWITQVDLKSNNPRPYKTKGRCDREDRGRDRSDSDAVKDCGQPSELEEAKKHSPEPS